jgi:hypothetical protein
MHTRESSNSPTKFVSQSFCLSTNTVVNRLAQQQIVCCIARNVHRQLVMTNKQYNNAAKALSHKLQRLHIRTKNAISVHRIKRKVTFRACEYNEVRVFVTEEIPANELWFTSEEFQQIKAQSRCEAREWRRMGYNKLLNNSFNIVASNHDGMMSKYDQQSFINAFCAFDGILNRRGLERFCSQKHGEERSEAKTRSKYAVLDTQRQFKRNGSHDSSNADQMVKAISAKYIQCGREAKIFARRMGIGDEHAVMAQKQVDHVQDILNICHAPKMQRRLSSYSASTASSNVSSLDSRVVPINIIEKRIPAPKKQTQNILWNDNKELYAAIA